MEIFTIIMAIIFVTKAEKYCPRPERVCGKGEVNYQGKEYRFKETLKMRDHLKANISTTREYNLRHINGLITLICDGRCDLNHRQSDFHRRDRVYNPNVLARKRGFLGEYGIHGTEVINIDTRVMFYEGTNLPYGVRLTIIGGNKIWMKLTLLEYKKLLTYVMVGMRKYKYMKVYNPSKTEWNQCDGMSVFMYYNRANQEIETKYGQFKASGGEDLKVYMVDGNYKSHYTLAYRFADTAYCFTGKRQNGKIFRHFFMVASRGSEATGKLTVFHKGKKIQTNFNRCTEANKVNVVRKEVCDRHADCTWIEGKKSTRGCFPSDGLGEYMSLTQRKFMRDMLIKKPVCHGLVPQNSWGNTEITDASYPWRKTTCGIIINSKVGSMNHAKGELQEICGKDRPADKRNKRETCFILCFGFGSSGDGNIGHVVDELNSRIDHDEEGIAQNRRIAKENRKAINLVSTELSDLEVNINKRTEVVNNDIEETAAWEEKMNKRIAENAINSHINNYNTKEVARILLGNRVKVEKLQNKWNNVTVDAFGCLVTKEENVVYSTIKPVRVDATIKLKNESDFEKTADTEKVEKDDIWNAGSIAGVAVGGFLIILLVVVFCIKFAC